MVVYIHKKCFKTVLIWLNTVKNNWNGITLHFLPLPYLDCSFLLKIEMNLFDFQSHINLWSSVSKHKTLQELEAPTLPLHLNALSHFPFFIQWTKFFHRKAWKTLFPSKVITVEVKYSSNPKGTFSMFSHLENKKND